MKKLLLFSLVLFAGLGFQSCDDNEDEAVSPVLNIRAFFDTEAFVSGETYSFDSGKTINFLKSDYFISEITLIRESGEEEVVNEIDLVDIAATHNSEAASANGYSLSLKSLKPGNFKGIRFGIGVPAASNAKKDTDFPSSHPLSNSNFYWSAWQSYIFTRTEGYLSPGPNNQKGFTYHTGTDELFRTITINHSFSISKTGDKIPLRFDLQQLIKDGSGYIDIENNPTAHGIDDLTLATIIMNNFPNALSWN